MNKQDKIEFVAGMIEESLAKYAGIEGVKPVKRLIKELEEEAGSPFGSVITVISNKNFTLEYHDEKSELVFATSYSNQVVDKKWLDQALLVYQYQKTLESSIKNFIFVVNS